MSLWIDHLPPNLELLSMLDPSSPSISNVALSPPIAFDIVRPSKGVSQLADNDFREYVRQESAKKRAHAESSPRSSSRSRRASDGIARDDVLASLHSLTDLANFFVLGFTGMLQSGSADEFRRLIYAEGIKADCSFTDVTMKDFAPVFAVAWGDLIDPCSGSNAQRSGIGTIGGLARSLGCSKDKAKRLLECYKDIAHIIMQAASEVSMALWVGLRKAA